jgi:hypothetical protein
MLEKARLESQKPPAAFRLSPAAFEEFPHRKIRYK